MAEGLTVQRNLVDVLTDLLRVVPYDQPCLRGALCSLRASAEFAAPEVQGHWWRKAADSLEHHLKGVPADAPWRAAAEAAWLGRPTDEGTVAR